MKWLSSGCLMHQGFAGIKSLGKAARNDTICPAGISGIRRENRYLCAGSVWRLLIEGSRRD